MRSKKSLKVNFSLSLLLALLLLPSLNYAQHFAQERFYTTLTDTTTVRPVQYRRGIELQEGYQSYEQYYTGKNLTEEKRRLFPLQSTGVWTELNPKVPRVDYLGIHFVNKDTGWAVGDLGTLIKSTDGGTSWTVSETNTTTPILKVRSFDGQVVIASGFGGLIHRSTDGGETFTQVASGVTGDLWGLQMINDTLGWACGNANSLTKTTDAGQTWQRIFTPGYTSDYWWIDFMNESYGFIAANGKVLRTIDGGQNWEIIQAGDSYPLFSIDVIDSLHIAAAGYGGTGYAAKNIYTSDGGYTWINGQQTTTHEINCVQYINTDTGYIAMSEIGMYKTTNRGQNWQSIAGIASIGEYEFILLFENSGYATGTSLKIFKTENGYENWQRLIVNDNFADVYFTSETIGYIASRTVYKTISSGMNWFMLQSFPTNVFTSALNSLTFTDSLIGFAGGPPCRIVKTTDAGDTWYLTNRTGLTDTIGTINKIFFINSYVGWAVTSRGGILKTTDGGNNWFAQLNAGVSIIIRSIYCVDSLYCWTANSDRPFKTTDGGQNWIQQTNLNIWFSNDIYFKNYVEGWIVDQTSWTVLRKTIDGGLNWLAVPEIFNAFRFHYFPDPNHWLINGTPQRYITEDAGNSWIEITNDVPSGFNSFNGITDFLGYAVGGLGLILSYNDTSFVPVELYSFEGKLEINKVRLTWVTTSELNNSGFFIQKSLNKKKWFDIGFVEGAGTSSNKNYYSFIDDKITSGIQYYQLKQQNNDGSLSYSQVVEIDILINDFALSQNFPNPANSSTTISFSIPTKTNVKINLYTLVGDLVGVILDEEKDKGIYNINVDLNNLASGIYFYKMLTSKGYTNVKKMILLK